MINSRGTWRTYTTADGLASLDVSQIVQDHEGYLWFGTCAAGVSRFDGEQFRTFTTRDGLVGQQVRGLLCDRQGRVWCATTFAGGMCWYEGGSFHRFAADSWASRGVFTCVYEDRDGRIWFCGRSVGYLDERGLDEVTEGYRQVYGEGPAWCSGIAQDPEGCLWFGCERLMRWDGQRWRQFDERDGLTPQVGALSMYLVACDQDGVLWVGRGPYLWRRRGDSFALVADRPRGRMVNLQADREGRLWVCADAVAWYDGSTFQQLRAPGDDGPVPVVHVCLDREGLLWLAAPVTGARCYDPEGLQTVAGADRNQGARPSAVALGPGGRVWIGGLEVSTATADRTVRIAAVDGLTGTPQDWGVELASTWGLALACDQVGRLWIGAGDGLYCCEQSVCRRVWPAADGPPVWVAAVATDARGGVCFSYMELSEPGRDRPGGLLRWDGQGCALLAESQPWAARAIAVSASGALWLGLGTFSLIGMGGGLAKLDRDGTLSSWTTVDGLVDNSVRDVLEDGQGRVWIATMAGLGLFDGSSFRTFGVDDGLPAGPVYCLCQDRRGRLWLGLDGALGVHDGGCFQVVWLQPVAPVFDLLEDERGDLWLATGQGTMRYTPQCVAPRVRLTQIVADQVYAANAPVRFLASVPQIQFEYQGIGCRTAPRDMLYACRLRGHQDTWQPPRRTRRILFPSLPAGEYCFEVKAIDRDLNASPPASVQVVVEPDLRLEGLTEALSAGGPAGEFVGESAAMRHFLQQLHQAAGTDATVLMLGETGTGKGLAARALHAFSQRRRRPFITVSCGALPEGLVESELFGHERGAFTGAVQRKLGKVELAAEGTLFLDEIGDLPLAAQTKLLRLLEEGTFERVGGTRELTTTARLVAATNRDLEQMVAAGSFRTDLYYRLQVLPLRLPPLRERREDIELLALHFLHRTAAHLHKVGIEGFTPAALAALQRHDWPGNVRELEHVVRRAVITATAPRLCPEDVVLGPALGPRPAAPEIVPLQEHERRYLLQVLEYTGGAVYGPRGAAQLLGLPPATLYGRMKKLGIQRP